MLELDEAQDIGADKYDKQISPMAAQQNATRVFWGTAWTGQTLLARELRAARKSRSEGWAKARFQIGARVRAEVPAYGRFVDDQVARLGRSHPMVRSQFFSEEIDFASGLFSPVRLSLMLGSHLAQNLPTSGKRYAMLVDLAGEDEQMRNENFSGDNASLDNPKRDSTAVTVVEVDLSLMDELLPGKPRYRVVQRYLWQGENTARSTKGSTGSARIGKLKKLWLMGVASVPGFALFARALAKR